MESRLSCTYLSICNPLHTDSVLEIFNHERRGRFSWIFNTTAANDLVTQNQGICEQDDDVIKWKRFLRHWSVVRGIHRSPVNSPHKGQWRKALMFSLICAWISGLVHNREACDLRRHRAHYDVTVIYKEIYPMLEWALSLVWSNSIYALISVYFVGILWDVIFLSRPNFNGGFNK